MNRHGIIRPLAVAVGLLLLTACAVIDPREVPDDRNEAWQDQRERLEAMNAWHAEGRMSVRMDGDGGSAGFDWRERPDGQYLLRLSGPWGQGVARLTGDNGHARLDTGDGDIVEGPDAALLLLDRYGWDIPVDGLRRWVIGLPTADAEPDSYSIDRFGRMEALRWRDWEIRYLRYRMVNELELPARMDIRRDDDGAQIRVAVDRWRSIEEDAAAPRDSGVPLIGE